MGFIGDIASAITGGIFGYEGQESANNTNMAIAQRQMDFQREMSNTAWQRGVKDMRAAGINPMLAYKTGGASSPSGAAIPVGNAGAAAVQGASSAVSAYNSSRSVKADVDQKLIQNENLKAQKAQINASTAQSLASADQSMTQSQANSARAALDIKNAQSVDISNKLKALTIPSAVNMSNKAKTWWGRYVTPYLDDVGSLVSTGARAALAF